MTSIQGIYIALYGRPADPAGLAHYTVVTNNGEDLSAIGDLSSVPEYQDRFADMSSDEIVTSIYESLFERAPDAEGLAFYVSLLEESSANINRIAIDILNGAQNEDLATINAKIEAADLFSMHLDTDAEVAAYQGNDAAAVGRAFIDTVNADDEGTGEEADAYILMLFPDQGQAPGEESSAGGGGGGTSTTFSVSVSDGALTFGGNATGAVTVVTNGNGELQFSRGGRSDTLDADEQTQTFSSLPDDVTIQSGGASNVLAYNEVEGWFFVTPTSGVDALDFYSAVGQNKNIFLLSGFDVENLGSYDSDDNTPPSMLTEAIGEISGLEDVLALLSTSVNAEIVAADGAKTSLNGLIHNIIGIPGDEDEYVSDVDLLSDGSYDLPNIGLPILITGDADFLSANSETGFALIGRLGADDTLVGGRGDDILVGLGDKGTADFDIGLYANTELGSPRFAWSSINDEGEFVIVPDYNEYAGPKVGFTAIAEPLANGTNVMRVSSTSDQTVTITRSGDPDFSVSVELTKGEIAFVNVGQDGTYKLHHDGGMATKATGDIEAPLEQGFNAALVTFGDKVSGGEGADLFAYLPSDGVDLITDFSRKDGDKLLLTGETKFFNDVDVDGDGEVNDTFIAFYDYESGGFMLDAGIGIVGTPDVGLGDLEGFGATPN